MAGNAVFLDRDNTLIEDPGYLGDPGAVKLLPGVELALKGLAEGGYKLVLVTNQSGVARGLITEEALGAVHEELRRQLAERGAPLDAIYYCPYLAEGTVEAYARDSDERKPRPGMLLRAAREMDLDLAGSWMVGDSPRDIEAGQRAGCRTVRVRSGTESVHPGAAGEDEDAQADFFARNLVEAARVILRESPPADRPSLPDATAPAGPTDVRGEDRKLPAMTDSEVLRELLRHARQLVRMHHVKEFSVTKLVAGISQGVALLSLGMGAIKFIGVNAPSGDQDSFWLAMGWLGVGAVLQLVALTFFIMSREG